MTASPRPRAGLARAPGRARHPAARRRRAGRRLRARRPHRSLVFTSGQLPFVDGGLRRTGKVGGSVDVEAAAADAKVCALNALAAIDDLVGLDSVARIVRVVGYVASAEGFTGQPRVVNGASELLGQDLRRGRPARPQRHRGRRAPAGCARRGRAHRRTEVTWTPGGAEAGRHGAAAARRRARARGLPAAPHQGHAVRRRDDRLPRRRRRPAGRRHRDRLGRAVAGPVGGGLRLRRADRPRAGLRRRPGDVRGGRRPAGR